MADTTDTALIKTLSLPLYQSKGWMKLIGVMMILYGALIALSIVGIIVAWLPLWMGILLFQAASAAEDAQVKENPDDLLNALNRLRTYFTIMGVLTLVGLIFAILGFFTGMTGMYFGAGGHMGYGNMGFGM
jgi:1,4-dihydroxy-2-naphthoate octaprenyltransferase